MRAERDRYNETEGESGEMPLLEALDAFLDAEPEQGKGGGEGRVLGERARGMARLTGELAEALELARQHFDSVEGYVSSLRSIADAVLAEHPAPAQPAEHPASSVIQPAVGPAQDGAGADLPRSGIPLLDHDYVPTPHPAVDACDKRVSDNPDGRPSRQCGRPRREHRKAEGGK